MRSKRRLLAGLALMGVGGAAYVAYVRRRPLLARLLRLPPVQVGVTREENIRVPLADGLTLATDLYRPQASGRHPTVLIRTPYGRANLLTHFTAQRLAERGYNVVCQDVRGRFDSDGEFEPYVHEAADGQTTIEWIVQQPWSDGQVAMWGQSYVGYVQWAAAAAATASPTPHLKALVPTITMAHLGYDGQRPLTLDRTLRWLLLLDAMENAELSALERLGRTLRADVQDRAIAPGWSHLPLATADEAVFGKPIPLYRTWVAHNQPDSAYWTAVDHRPKVKDITIPVHLVAGWYDIFLDGQLADYTALREAGREPYLTIGPWTHIESGGRWESLRVAIDWFDAHLKGRRQRLPAKPVRLYVMGAGEWRDYDAWPVPASLTPYYLQAQARLSPDLPPADSPSEHYRYDPADPTPNVGGPLLSSRAGPKDNRQLEARADVLTYTTLPLAQAVEVIGPVKLALFARSSREYTDFFGRLCDVYPDGRSINVCDGLFRVEPGRGERQADGSLYLEVDMTATAYRFRQGHSIRLQVSSGAHPRYARNLGTGEPALTGTAMVAAEQTIYHDEVRPSALLLPIAAKG